MTLQQGQDSFFLHKEKSWTQGKVVSSAGNGPKLTYTCKDKDGEVDGLKKDDVYPIHNLAQLDEDYHDLLSLPELHESYLLHVLQKRYYQDVVYTTLGALVVALNPFKYTIPWYVDDKMPDYLAEGPVIRKNKPHSWVVAHNTYYEMVNDSQNQCVLVSGESGAGKTEAVKIVLKYLGEVSSLKGSAEQKKIAQGIRTKLILASPILESFGNAKTVRNDNSSRFGKFLQVQFDKTNFIVGSFTINYLLEKSRVISAAKDERVYHAFYQILRGKDAAKFKLENIDVYPSVNSGECTTVNGINDADGEELSYTETTKAMATVGMTGDEIEAVWRTVAGILHLYRVQFGDSGGDATIQGGSDKYIDLAAEVWKIPADKVKTEMLQTLSVVRGEQITKKHTKNQAVTTRDSLVKAMYFYLFNWLVAKINIVSNQEADTVHWIGLLDIFGFEDFQKNSFEQLCINLANETLQQHYNVYIFEKDVEECKAEGINVSKIAFVDNKPTVELLTQKMGVFALLDEECALGKGTDMGFLKKCEDAFSKKHNSFEKKNLQKTSFTIKHYAGDVKYEVEHFLEKNRDTLKDDLKLLFRNSGCALIKTLLPEPVDKRGRAPTVSGTFRTQITQLMDMINCTNPHWIRCIKPHPAKKPALFHPVTVMNQLRCSGVLETVKMRKAGYPIRIVHKDFMMRFRILHTINKNDPKASCQGILNSCKYTIDEAQLGTTKVFLRAHIYNDIEDKKRVAITKYAIVIQHYCRGLTANYKRQQREVELNKVILEFFDACVKKREDIVCDEEQKREQFVTTEDKQFNELRESFLQRTVDLMREIYESHFNELQEDEEGWRADIEHEEAEERLALIEEKKADVDKVRKEIIRKEHERRLAAKAEEEKRLRRAKIQAEKAAQAARLEEEEALLFEVLNARQELHQKERAKASAMMDKLRQRTEKEIKRLATQNERKEQMLKESLQDDLDLQDHIQAKHHQTTENRMRLEEERAKELEKREARRGNTQAEVFRRQAEQRKWDKEKSEILEWEREEMEHVKKCNQTETRGYFQVLERIRREENELTQEVRQESETQSRRVYWEMLNMEEQRKDQDKAAELRARREAEKKQFEQAKAERRAARLREKEDEERRKRFFARKNNDIARRQREEEDAKQTAQHNLHKVLDTAIASSDAVHKSRGNRDARSGAKLASSPRRSEDTDNDLYLSNASFAQSMMSWKADRDNASFNSPEGSLKNDGDGQRSSRTLSPATSPRTIRSSPSRANHRPKGTTKPIDDSKYCRLLGTSPAKSGILAGPGMAKYRSSSPLHAHLLQSPRSDVSAARSPHTPGSSSRSRTTGYGASPSRSRSSHNTTGNSNGTEVTANDIFYPRRSKLHWKY